MSATVLLLEDDVALACEIQATLAQMGCSVETLRDGNAGLARAIPRRFALIVASLELPGMNGFRLCNRLKKDNTTRAPPIFLLASRAAAGEIDSHRRLPTRANSYFEKPV